MVTVIGTEVAPGPRVVGQPVIVTVMAGSKPELLQEMPVAVAPLLFVIVNVCGLLLPRTISPNVSSEGLGERPTTVKVVGMESWLTA